MQPPLQCLHVFLLHNPQPYPHLNRVNALQHNRA
jgi:hypothetical protein